MKQSIVLMTLLLLAYATALVIIRPSLPDADAKCPGAHSSSLTTAVPNPFIFHERGMTSTWEFDGFRGHFPHGPSPALGAWWAAYEDGEERIMSGHGSQRLGTQTRTWSGTAYGERVDLVLRPREEMTWRMLWEAFCGAKQLICLNGREFDFRVLAEGVEGDVGWGNTMTRRRRTVAAGQRLNARTAESPTLKSPTVSFAPVPKVNLTAVTARDPFAWHTNEMISTWVFFGYWGHLDYNAAAAAGRLASAEATHHNPDTPIGVPTRTWSAAYRDSETVDLVLVARPDMTWKMLAEGITGLQMLVFGGKELNFVITARGVEGHVGYGQMKRREAASGRGLAARVVRESGTTLPIVPAARTSGRKVFAFRDPYIRHDADMITSWEYFGYRGSLNVRACHHAWLWLFQAAVEQVNLGRGGVPLGTQTMHWPLRDGDEWVDLVVVPREAMTWRMLQDGARGGIVVCANTGKGFQFGLIADGIEGEMGFGQITARHGEAATSTIR